MPAHERPPRWRTKLSAHLELIRPYTLAYAGLLATAGAFSGPVASKAGWRAFLAASTTMCGWLAGHYVGDYFDRHIDALTKPDRPLPSGRISPREAQVAMVSLIGLGQVAALSLGPINLLLAVLTTVLGIGYSSAFKSRALLGNFDRGLLGACAVIFGGVAAVGRVSPRLLLLGSMVVCHDGATNLVGALRDVDGDRRAGCTTAPVVYGIGPSVIIARSLAALAWLLGGITLVSSRPNRVSSGLFAIASATAGWVYLVILGSGARVSRATALRAHKFLVVERLLLTAAFVAVRAPRLALGLTALSVPTSMGLQLLMRDRHEGLVL